MVLGLSERTVRNVCMEYDKGTGSFSSPKKRYSGSRVRKDADNFDREALRMIHSFYEKKENLILHKILVNNHADCTLFYRDMLKSKVYFQGKDFILQGIERYGVQTQEN